MTVTRWSALRCTRHASTPGSGRPIDPGLMSKAAVLAIMMPPVSVCHQLSWIGSPRTSRPHHTASGFSGSPTLATNRRSGGCENFRARSSPALISMRIAVGAVYHTDTFSCSRIRYQRSASKSSGSTIEVMPWSSGAMIPYDVPVTQPGGSAVHQ